MGKTFVVESMDDMCKLMCDNIVPQQKQYDRCLRCGRKLKTLENRIRGYGKICWEKQKKSDKFVKKLFTN